MCYVLDTEDRKMNYVLVLNGNRSERQINHLLMCYHGLEKIFIGAWTRK